MAKRNTYQVLPPMLSLETKVMVDAGGVKEARYISFKGKLVPRRTPGKLVTMDPDLIKAMDKDGDNGKKYKLIRSEKIKDEVAQPEIDKERERSKVENEKIQAQANVNAANEKIQAQTPDPDPAPLPPTQEEKVVGSDPEKDFISVAGITTGTKAKEYMVKNFETPMSAMRNKAQIKEVAKENGIVFPDLSD